MYARLDRRSWNHHHLHLSRKKEENRIERIRRTRFERSLPWNHVQEDFCTNQHSSSTHPCDEDQVTDIELWGSCVAPRVLFSAVVAVIVTIAEPIVSLERPPHRRHRRPHPRRYS